MPDPSISPGTSGNFDEAIAPDLKRGTLVGSGIQKASSPSAYMIGQSGAESADTQHFSWPRPGFVQRATSTCAGPCSLSRMATRTSVPSCGALFIGFHSPRIAEPAMSLRYSASPCEKSHRNQLFLAFPAVFYHFGRNAVHEGLP